MSIDCIQFPHDSFRPLYQQMVWSVRRDVGREVGSSLQLEFGSPHLEIRQPINASPGASPKVRRLLARRRVWVVGDWHLWVMNARWEIRTTDGTANWEDADHARIDAALHELDGQILSSCLAGPTPASCVLNFDLGAALHIWLDPSIDGDQWSLHGTTEIVVCDAKGNIIVEERNAE